MAPRRSPRWPGTAKAQCWRSPLTMATPACWRFSGHIGGLCRFPREQSVPTPVDTANNFAVNNMSLDDRKRAYRMDMLLACTMVAAGLIVSGLSLAQLKASNPQMAQATQPLQSSPTAAPPDNAPAESKAGRGPPAHPGARACTSRCSSAEVGLHAGATVGSG